jgi:N-acetylglucosaminyl-diphospho-decaprenol L-rhamnosyltransferase
VTPGVSIVIVSYRCREAARACLASIFEHRPEVAFEVIVLDNASGDGTAEMVASEFPDVRLLALEDNLGFAAGCNRAAEEARGEYVLLLNPDTVVHEGAIDNLVGFARARPEHGLYGGRTLDPDGSVNPGSCWALPSLWSLTCFATMLSWAFKGSRLFDPEAIGGWRRDTVREVGIVTGCLLLVPTPLWRELDGFDTRFFMYGEDADLALRAHALGFRPAITPESVVTHEIGVSSSTRPDKLVLLFRGKVTLLRKHWSPVRRRLGITLLLLGVGARALLASVRSAGSEDRATAWPAVWAARRSWLEGYAAEGVARERLAAPTIGPRPAGS